MNGNHSNTELMEITSPLHKPALHPLRSSSSYSSTKRKSYYTSTTLAVPASTASKSPKIQIQLPLHRPQRKERPPINLNTTSSSTAATTTITTASTTSSTTSDVLQLMDILGLSIPPEIYTSLIKECTKTRDPDGAIKLHTHIRTNIRRPRTSLVNRLLLMYVSCGCMDNARHLFDEMSVRDVNSWAAMIAGYMDSENYEEAIDLFVEMQRRHLQDYHRVLEFPGSWILVCILKACVHTMDLELGRQVHGKLLKSGCSENLFLSSSLINFYGKVGYLEGADFVFDQISRRNTVVWTARVVNNCKNQRFDEVLNVFLKMGREGVRRNSFTFSSVLRACGKIGDGGCCGKQVHANAIKLGLVSKSYVQSGLVGMYGKFGFVKEARRVFEMNGEKRNAACWSAILTGYIQHGFCVEAIKILYEMKAAGLEPQESLLNEVRCACGSKTLLNRIAEMCIC